MIRKFLGIMCVLAFIAGLVGCGSSSSGTSSDECSENPSSPNCVDPNADPATTPE